MFRPLLLAAAALFSAPALAQGVDLTSQVWVIHPVTAPDGTVTETREEPATVLPGDAVEVELTYRNDGAEPAENFSAVNPIPAGLAYTSSAADSSEVSVDGGEHWGQLAALTVPVEDADPRPATPADVTHVRFRAPGPVPPGAAGRFAFRAEVR